MLGLRVGGQIGYIRLSWVQKDILGIYELESKLLVSPVITIIILPIYLIPFTTPVRSLDYDSHRELLGTWG